MKNMKKIILLLLTFIIASVATYTYWSQVVTLITESGKYEKITISSWEATVFGFPRKIENIEFSKDSGFTIRTLEWGIWRDLSDDITDYSPITWILARNMSEWDLVITATYAEVTSIENTIFQKSLKAGWNLISPAYKDDISWVVNTDNALWDALPYSQVLDFTWNGFVYSGENVIDTPNHNLNDTWYEIKTKAELTNVDLIEKLAYGLFVNVDSVVSGSQKMTDLEFTEDITEEIIELPSITNITLPNINTNIWDESIDLIKFNIDNTTSSNSGTIDKISVELVELSWDDTISPSLNYIDSLSLYRDGSLITSLSWSSITSSWSITFDWLTQNINPLSSTDYTIKINIINNPDLVWKSISTFNWQASYLFWSASATSTFWCDIITKIVSGTCNSNNVITIINEEVTNLEANIYTIDALNDQVRQDKTNVTLGQIQITNGNNQNLLLKNLGIELTTSNNNLWDVLENVEFEINGTVYDLASANTWSSTSTYSTTNLWIVLPQGVSILRVRADTLDNLTNGETITMSLTVNEENLKITDNDANNIATITPSSLIFNNLTITQPTATIPYFTLFPLTEIVKGATDIVALEFEIEASAVSNITTNQIKIHIDSSGTWATKDQVSEVALYKGSVSESNLLNKISGSNLASGNAIFNEFQVEIPAWMTETFIVTLSTVDQASVIDKVLTASIVDTATDISLEDDENDVVTLASSTINGKQITVKDSGQLVLTADQNNRDNQNPKTLIAWEETIIYSADIKATNEEVNVEHIYLTLNNDNLTNVIESAKLYLDDTVVATALNSDIDWYWTWVIAFRNIINLDFPTYTSELKLVIKVKDITEWVTNVSVTKVVLNNINWVDSGEWISVQDLVITWSNTFDVTANNIATPWTATIANVPLANVEVVKGASDLVALQFEIEAWVESDITVNQIKVHFDASWTWASTNELTQVELYKNSLAGENVLDTISATNLINWDVIFNWFNTLIWSGTTETFIVTLSTVDTSTVINKVLTASITDTATDISLEDDENDIVTLDSWTVQDKEITVKDSGQLTLTSDPSNTDNQNAKTILAWTESIIYSADIKATNEEVNVWTIVFTLDNNLINEIASAKLYLDNTVVATASNSDVLDAANSTITFDNIWNLNIPTETAELKLAIATNEIGYEKIGETLFNASVTNVSIQDAEGVDSYAIVTVDDLTTTASNTFDVVPAKITPTILQNLNTWTAKLKLIVDYWNNTIDTGSAQPNITINNFKFIELGNQTDWYAILRDWFVETGHISSTGNFTVWIMTWTHLTVNNDAIFNIIPGWNLDQTYTLNMTKTAYWIDYNVNWIDNAVNLKMKENLNLWTITY